MALPPVDRGPLGLRLTAAATRGVLELPVCKDCGCVQYPPREVCAHCLSSALDWRAVEPVGELLAVTILHHSNEPYFADRLPRRVGLVKIADGAQAVVHLVDGSVQGAAVVVRAVLDRGGQGVLVAHAPESGMEERYRAEFTCP